VSGVPVLDVMYGQLPDTWHLTLLALTVGYPMAYNARRYQLMR
jgi:hypothetical protein